MDPDPQLAGAAAFLVQRGLLDLRREHPDVVVELMGGNRPVDIARGEADIALRVEVRVVVDRIGAITDRFERG